jgi:hypothetical protein
MSNSLSTSQSSVLTTAPQTNVSRNSVGEEVRVLKCDQTTAASRQCNSRRPASNVLVNTLTGAFGISIARNGDSDAEDISEGLVGATTDGTSISTLCERSQDSYSGNVSAITSGPSSTSALSGTLETGFSNSTPSRCSPSRWKSS